MEKEPESPDKLFGLVGKGISYSFSRDYFTRKFEALGLNRYRYVNFDIPSIAAFPAIIKQNPGLKGLNVTIPYKEQIIPYLHRLSGEAAKIGAVNTLVFAKEGLTGHNTDCFGFKKSLVPLLKPHHKKALILGTGGASKAIAYTLKTLGIPYHIVSRNPGYHFRYTDVNEAVLQQHTIIINCTPLGTATDIDARPAIPYRYLSPHHLLYDLVYNPAETTFLKTGKKQGAQVCNGLSMLQFQAEKAWALWHD
ncbi:MAG: shikimate dehydrogenase [Sinomicrobium sp.]|nr:shikimate dehydrogenase [Sinomicrobium sp.]